MPLDPFTGRYMPYDDPVPQISPQGLPAALDATLEAQPGFIQAAIMQSTRSASTMMYGGFDASSFRPSGIRSGTADRIYELSSRAGEAKDFTFIGRRLGGQNPIVKPFLRNISPRGLLSGQYADLSVFAPLSQGRYNPAGFTANMMNQVVASSQRVRGALGVQDGVDNPFSSGLMSSLQATSRTDALEKKMVKALQKGDTRTAKRISARLGRVDSSVEALLRMNNPSMVMDSVSTGNVLGAQNRVISGRTISYNNRVYTGGQFLPNSYTPVSNIGISGSGRLMEQSGQAVGQVGVRGNLMVSGLATETMQRYGGFFRGAAGFGGEGGLSVAAQAGADRARFVVQRALEYMDANAFQAVTGSAKMGPISMNQADDVLKTLKFRDMGKLVEASRAAGASGRGMAAVFGARGVQAAAKFAGPIGWVMLAYDAGKLAGRGVAGGINLAKDAAKSFQGSIYKPAFGMGYRDNEVAATSRARGVMAIQNSRLNARSVLGSEGAMMAAHFG